MPLQSLVGHPAPAPSRMLPGLQEARSMDRSRQREVVAEAVEKRLFVEMLK